MSKTDIKSNNNIPNPFLTDKAEELWKRLDKQAKPVSKEELIQRAKALKAKNRS